MSELNIFFLGLMGLTMLICFLYIAFTARIKEDKREVTK